MHNEAHFFKDYYKAIFKPTPIFENIISEQMNVFPGFDSSKPYVCLHMRRNDAGADNDGRYMQDLPDILEVTRQVLGNLESRGNPLH